MQRRTLIQWMVSTGGLAAFSRLSARELDAMGREVHHELQRVTPHDPGQGVRAARVLDAHATRTIAIASEHIIPASDTPGATAAGVPAFVDTMLADWYPPPDRDRFLAGVRALDRESQARHGQAFADATNAQQLVLLGALDDEVAVQRVSRGATANEHWFAMLKYLTVWGYCTSEVGMRQTLHALPLPMRYDGAARIR